MEVAQLKLSLASWMQISMFSKNVWDAHAQLTDSGTWKFISEVKQYALESMRREIGNGNSTLLWYEPWLN